MPACDGIDLIMFGTRATVLVLCALAGIMCIYLGWRLYRDAITVSTKGEFQAGGFKFKVVSLGPGVFLVGLGVWLLASVANRPVQSQDVEPIKPTAVSTDRPKSFIKVADVAKPQPPSTPSEPCLVRQRVRVMATGGEDLTAKEIADVAQVSSDALRRAKEAGIADVGLRVDAITKLNRLAELAKVTHP